MNHTLTSALLIAGLAASLAIAIWVDRRELAAHLSPARLSLRTLLGVTLFAIAVRIVAAPWDPLAAQGVAFSRAFSSNWLWGAAVDTIALLGAPRTVSTAQWLNLVFSSLSASAAFVCGVVACANFRRSLAAALLVAVWPQIIAYSTSLWEAPSAMFANVVAAIFFLIAAQRPTARTILAANLAALPLVFSRKEGFALAAILAVTVAIPQASRWRDLLRRSAPYVPVLLLGVLVSRWRTTSFGAEAPDTLVRLGIAIVILALAARRSKSADRRGEPRTFAGRFIGSGLGLASIAMGLVEFAGPDNFVYPFARFETVVLPLAIVAIAAAWESGRPAWPRTRPRDLVVLVAGLVFAHGIVGRSTPHNEHQELVFMRRAFAVPADGDVLVTALARDLHPVDDMQSDDKLLWLYRGWTATQLARDSRVLSLGEFLGMGTPGLAPGRNVYLYVGLDSVSQLRQYELPQVSQVLARCDWQIVSSARWRNILIDFNALDQNYTTTLRQPERVLARARIYTGSAQPPREITATLYRAGVCRRP